MGDDTKVGHSRLDVFSGGSARAAEAGDAPDLQYITTAELERLRARIDHLEGLLWAIDATARYRGDEYGVPDCIDAAGKPYQSEDLHQALKRIDQERI